MWNRKEEDKTFKNQMMGHDPADSELSYVEKMKFQHSIGAHDKLFLTEASRQRKEDLNEGNSISDDVSSLYRRNLGSNLGNVLRESIPQHSLGAFQAINTQGGTQEMLTAGSLQFAKPNVAWSQYGSSQFSAANNFSTNMQSSHVNFQKSAFDNLKPCIAHHKESCPLDKDGISLGHRNHILPSNSSFNPIITSYEISTSSKFPQVRMGKSEMLGSHHNLDERNRIQDFSYTGTACEVAKSSQNMSLTGTTDFSSSTAGRTQSSAVAGGNETNGSCQFPKIEIRSASYTWGDNLGASFHSRDDGRRDLVILNKASDCEESCVEYGGLKISANVSGDFRAKTFEKPDGLDSDDGNHSLKEKTLPEKIDNPVKGPDEPCGGPSCLNLDGLNKQLPGKVATVVPEKLWDGTIQLNTSTTVSAVAVFKSGEKAPEISWSKHVEVKGKVRLDAFEKYIQELPRSRHRALMVISLCWKVGSSDTGLIGMKEVAKGYKEGQRVGYAQFSPGFDLYVCPRSDAIITILAKYGFFKGMAAVEEDQDSLIGCVIWRRNQPSSNNVTKSSERKNVPSLEQKLDSPSGSAISQNPQMNSPLNITLDSECKQQATPGSREPAGVSSPLKSSAFDGAKFTTEAKNFSSTNDPVRASSVHTNTAPSSTPLVPYNPSVIAPQLHSTQKLGVSPSQDLTKCLPDAEIMQNTEMKKPHAGVEPPPPTLSRSPQIFPDAHRSSNDLDDDDLPEFDFGNVCGTQQPRDSKFPWPSHNTCLSEDPSCLKQPPVEGSRNAGVAMPLALPSERPTNLAQRPHAPSFFGSQSDANQGIVSPKRIGEHIYGGHPAIQTTESSSALGTVKTDNSLASQEINTFFPEKRHIWDDDDDMPEWCPPNLQYCPPLQSLPPPPPLQPLPPPALQPLPSQLPLQPLPPPPLLPPPHPPPTLLPPPPPPTMPRPSFLSPHLTPAASSSFRSLPPYNQKSSYELQPGLLGQQPFSSNPRLPVHTRPVSGFDRLNRRPSPEPKPEPRETKRRRRGSGWDVKPWEVKPDPWHVGERRGRS